jgi:hypothetical protein
MKNLIEMAANKTLNEIVDTTIREALILKKEANEERDRQSKLAAKNKPCNFTAAHAFDSGASALCTVLWRLFGGCPADSIDTIRRIVAENQSEILGHDSQDYVGMFMDAFKG